MSLDANVRRSYNLGKRIFFFGEPDKGLLVTVSAVSGNHIIIDVSMAPFTKTSGNLKNGTPRGNQNGHPEAIEDFDKLAATLSQGIAEIMEQNNLTSSGIVARDGGMLTADYHAQTPEARSNAMGLIADYITLMGGKDSRDYPTETRLILQDRKKGPTEDGLNPEQKRALQRYGNTVTDLPATLLIEPHKNRYFQIVIALRDAPGHSVGDDGTFSEEVYRRKVTKILQDANVDPSKIETTLNDSLVDLAKKSFLATSAQSLQPR